LDSYRNYSNGKIRVEFINPGEDENIKQELMMMGIPQVQFNVMEKDKYQVVNGYLGMAIKYGDQTEVIPVVQNIQDLEYQITLNIKKATKQINSVIGIVSSNLTSDINKEITIAYKKLQELYQMQTVDLTQASDIAADVNTLIIIGPKDKFADDQLKKLDAFLMRGGAMLILADGVKLGEGLAAEKNNTGLSAWLENYGFKLNQNLVLDVSAGIASFNQGFITFSTPYPFWPNINKDGFDQDNAAVTGLEGLIFPWPSSLDIAENKISSSTKISYIVKTSNKSWTQEDNFDLNPQQAFSPVGNIGQKNIAIAIFGKINSAYGNGATESGKLIVVGDSDFMQDGFLRGNGDGLIFFQNLADTLSLDNDLIKIRAKSISARPIKELSDGARNFIRYFNIFGLTFIVIILGMFRYFIRRKSRFTDDI